MDFSHLSLLVSPQSMRRVQLPPHSAVQPPCPVPSLGTVSPLSLCQDALRPLPSVLNVPAPSSQQLTPTDHLQHIHLRAKPFMHVTAFCSYKTVKKLVLSAPSYCWGNGGWEKSMEAQGPTAGK